MRRNLIALGVLLALGLTAACGGGAGTGERSQAPVPTSTVPGTRAATFPLTGMPAADAAKAARPAVAVKIDNAAAARPQGGLDQADLIYEEFTEGITRFVVVFHSSDAPTVGPVRSVRPADPVIVKPLGGPLVFSGGAPGVLDVVRSAGVAQVTEDDRETLRRRPDRRSPFNLYSTTEAIFGKAGAGAPPPPFSPFLRPGETSAPAGATPAASIRLAPAPKVTAAYAWDAGAGVWMRSTDGRPHLLEGGAQLSPKNVIIQYTPYAAFDADRVVRFPEVVGSGEALVFVAGTQVKARWTKSSATAVTTYVDAAGKPVPLTPGQTLVHLQEPGSAVTVG